ncbi:hypothetical protein [Streptomyces sp. S.PB5]|uniref:hypothetical protein n=1 Tax=Streptomyces sp. S.PB5 TaxID=3020844 RepID=UPI0025B1157F|nr:hypothetical protein [Streptomyces sp. S.PB5]MDN3023097.1 hypothetical protein [Streptomyces sp. S.PB5]
MYGHGAVPPARSAATVITLRVLFACAGLLSCGLLACVPLFRLAILRGKWFDWLLAWISLPLSVTGLAVVGSVPETDVKSDIALGVILLLGAFSCVYFLVMDIRYHNRPQQFGGYAPPQATTVPMPHGHAGYGYPQPASPYTTAPTHQPVPQQPPATAFQPPAPIPQPPPHQPAPARIDQVRAELDELSDYLRNHDGRNHGGQDNGGRNHGGHEGGR